MIDQSKRLYSVKEYYFSRKLREVSKMISSGESVINMGVGSPDMNPSQKVINAIKSSLSDPFAHKYQSYQGIPKLRKAISKFYIDDKNIFQKNKKTNNDIFFKPIDIGDNTIPNGNSIMLINLVRLGMMEQAKKLAKSLNGYLNIYKSHMMTAVRALDFFNNINSGKNCNEQGCKIDV